MKRTALAEADAEGLFKKYYPGHADSPRGAPDKDIIEAVILIKNTALMNIPGDRMIGALELTARVFTAMTRAGVNIIMISQSSSGANLSVVVDIHQLEKAEAALAAEFSGGPIRGRSHDKDTSVVMVVGSGMAGTPGVSARVFSAMGQARINVMMISQAASEHNISFVVSSKDAEKAVQELHREFWPYGVLS